MSDFLSGIVWTIFSIGLVTLSLIGTAATSGQGATLRDRILSSPSLSPLLIIHYFLPYGLVILGLFMDIMSQLPQGSIGIAIAIVAMILNRLAFGNTGYVSDLCEIPGLKSLSSSLMPQSLLFVSIVVTYLASFATTSVSTPLYSTGNTYTSTSAGQQIQSNVSTSIPSASARIGASWGLAGSVILFQLIGILTTPDCLSSSTIGGIGIPPSLKALLTVLVGAGIGGASGYLIAMQSWSQPSYNINEYSAPPPTLSSAKGPGFVRERFQLGSGLGEMPQQAAGVPVDMAKTSGAVTPGESSDQFVCEAYKNGQLVSSTLTE